MADHLSLPAVDELSGQMEFDLEVALDRSQPLSTLPVGCRFVQEGTGITGTLLGLGTGSAEVAIQNGTRTVRTTWALGTAVRRLRGSG